MTVSGRLFAVAAAVAMISSAAAALTSDEVLVVANANSADSLALAEIYSRARQIPPSHVLALKVTTNYSISREEYLSQIVSPISQYLLGKNLASSIKCIVLMYGMPAHVDPPANPYAAMNSIYNIEVKRCHYRMAVDYHLLATVCRKFPPPRTDGLTPLADLFETPMPAPSEPLMEWLALVADTDKVFSSKIAEMKELKDPSQIEVASRQMMALAMDIHGLEGLIKFITDAGLSDAPDVGELKKQLDQARLKQNDLRARQMDANSVSEVMASLRESGGVVAAKEYADQQAKATATLATASASVDSELSMMWQRNYPLDNFIMNPLFWRVDPRSIPANAAPALMTCRLDGPGRDYVARMIRDSVEVEKTGLSGTFYIDAGGPERAKQYDKVFRDLDRFLRDNTQLKVVMDESTVVFQPGTCPNAALYCGWYSLQKYVPAFDWVKGAVGWHVASFEAIHLRDPGSQEWCPKMIQNGVAATVGAVEEPYLSSFPHPDDFFPLLLTGKWTLAECYWRTVPLTSWRLILIGDPLYNPFKANPQVAIDALPPELLPPANFPSLGRIIPTATSFTTSAPASQPAPAFQPK